MRAVRASAGRRRARRAARRGSRSGAPRSPGRGPSRRCRSPSSAGHGPCAAGALGEPVHDRVAAVAQDDEQHAGAVRGRAPQRLDLVQRRAVADDGQHRAVGARHAQADRGGQREAEHAHRADEAERRGRAGCGRAAPGGCDGVSSSRIASRGRRSASACRTWPARSGSPGRGGGGGAGRVRGGGAGARASTASASAAQIAAGSPSTASSTGLRCASSGSCVIEREARAVARPAGPGRTGTGGARRCRRSSTASWGASISRSRARRAGRWPANSGWSCGKPACAAERLLEDRAVRGARRARSARPSPRRRRRRRRRRSRAARRRRARPRAPRPRRGRRPAERSSSCGPSDLVRLGRGRGPVVHRRRSRAPGRGR